MEPSDKDDSPEEHERNARDLRTLGMRAWAKTALSAQYERSSEMRKLRAAVPRFRDVTLAEMKGSEDEEIAIELVRWLALVFGEGREVHPDESATLKRIWKVIRPTDRDELIALAARLVSEYAPRFQELPEQWTPPAPGVAAWSPRQEVCNSLVVDLWATVHEGFEPLVPEASTILNGTLPAETADQDRRRLDRVAELLIDYKSDRGRRTNGGAGEGKLSAARIVAELNTLAGWPLGRKLNAHAVNNALDRWREKQIPNIGT